MCPPTKKAKLDKEADVAQLVEHDLAKVGVTSSSLVIRSKKGVKKLTPFFIFAITYGGIKY